MIDTNHVESHADRLARAFLDVSQATESLFAAADQKRDAERALEAAKAKILNDYAIDPKALGSNEESRKAKLVELTEPQRADLAICESAERKARHALDLANLELSAAKAHAGILDTLARAGAIVLATAPVAGRRVIAVLDELAAADQEGTAALAAAPVEPPHVVPMEQREESGTPRRVGRPPGSKNKSKESAGGIPIGDDTPGERIEPDERGRSLVRQVTEASSEVAPDGKWANDLDPAIGEVRPAPPAVQVAVEPEPVDDVPPPEAPALDAGPAAWSEPAPVEAPEPIVTLDQVAVLRGLFKAAQMAPHRQHEFLTTEYPGHPTTLMTLPAKYFEALSVLLNSKARAFSEIEQETLPPAEPPIEPAAIYEARGYDGAGQPVDYDPLVTEEEAAEVRTTARELEVTNADAVKAMREHFGVDGLMQLRRSQARAMCDRILANIIPF